MTTTTSFTTTDEFDPQDGDFGDSGEYPEAFGIRFTPKVSGISIGVGGFLIAAYLFWSQVLPVWTELSELDKQKQEKEAQVNQLSSTKVEEIIAQKRGVLEERKDLKEGVLQLFANDETAETLLLNINQFTNDSLSGSNKVKMSSFIPAGEKQPLTDDSLGSAATNNVEIKTVNIDIEGTFNQLEQFLQDVERLQPLIIVQNLNTSIIGSPEYIYGDNQLILVGQPILKTTLSLSAVFPNLQPLAPSAEGQPPVEGQPPAEGQPPTQ